MIEKVITLDQVSLIDFLGAENSTITELSKAFPESKVISRGNELRIRGMANDVMKINDIVHSLLQRYHKKGGLSIEDINQLLHDETDKPYMDPLDDALIYGTRGFKIAPRTENQHALVQSANLNDLVFAIGPAGTGKTYISVALAVRALKRKEIKKIIITRPAVEAGENLGFLPGDLKEKIDPYLRPIYDALYDMIPAEKLKFYMENNIVEVAPLAYMRGRTLNHAYILLDEAQNTTPMQIKMFLTRMGPESKMIITGDVSQVDLPKNQKSGLAEALEVLKNVHGIGFIYLTAEDVVRHKLVKNIISAYEKFAGQ